MNSAPESLFWYFVSERHAIYLRRMSGQPKPWTADSILMNYKFTNIFRELDRGTIWLRENFLEPHRDNDLGLIAFNICFYRAFNWRGTGEIIGWQAEWRPEGVKNILNQELALGNQVFTGAHIIRSEFGRPKVDSIVDLCSTVWDRRQDIVAVARETRSLESVFNTLLEIPYIGPFQSYEMTTDLKHTRVLEGAIDAYTWANAGPGAKRGLERLGMDFKQGAVYSMFDLLQRSAANLPLEFPVLEMRDVEHALCEFSKYCKVKFDEGRPKSRYAGAA